MGVCYINRLKLFAVSALVGISVTALPSLIISYKMNAGVKPIVEQVEPMSQFEVYAPADRYTDTGPDDNASLPQSGPENLYLSAAASRLYPTPGAKTFSSASNGVSSKYNFVYFRQNSPEYNNIPYGNQTIGRYGCGPTNMAVVVTSITGKFVSPVTLARDAENWGCFVSGAGTSLNFFQKAAAKYGVYYSQFNYNKQTVISHLKAGRMIICTMGPGHFTNGGHFITLRGITKDGHILIADTYSEENTYKEWTLDYLASQLKYYSMWVFWK